MVNFAVVGLGMGSNRAQMIKDTDGAELKCVVDLQADLAKKNGRRLRYGLGHGFRRRSWSGRH